MRTTPPKHLSREASKLWRDLVNEYGISDGAGLLYVERACESLDRLRSAQAVLKKEGLTVAGQGGTTKAHPCAAIERDAHSAFRQSLKALNLDLEPIGPIGRPSN